MTYTAEQLLAAQQSNVEALADLSGQAFAGFEKLVELNVAASKAAMSESFSHLQALLAATDAQQMLALQTGLVQPLVEKSAAYSRHVYDITSGTGAEFSKAFEEKFEQVQSAYAAMMDNMFKNAPAGSETAVAVMRSAMSAGQNAIESAQAAAKQAMALAENNMNVVATQAVNAASTTAKKR